MFYVYKIKNIINGKIYIGKSFDVEKRWLKHLSTARTGIQAFIFHKAINKYGKDNFEVSIIEECETDEEALKREIFWIAEYKTNIAKYGNKFGYNLTDGGDGVAGRNVSPETRLKISIGNKGKPKSEEHKIALSVGGKGKTLSEIHKAKIRVAGLGKIHTDEAKLKASIAKLGEKNPQSILNEQNVKEILNLIDQSILRPSQIGKIYGVASRTIRDIKNNITWKHIPRNKIV